MWQAFITSFNSVFFFTCGISKCWVSPGAFRAERLPLWLSCLDPQSGPVISNYGHLCFPKDILQSWRHLFVVTLGEGKLLASSNQRFWLFLQLLHSPPCLLFSDHNGLLWDSVQFSHSVMFDSLWSHGLQYARLPCSLPTPRTYSNSCPLSQWCHPTISSSVVPLSSHLQSFPASGSFPMSQFLESDGQSIGVSASASVLPTNIQDWFPLGWTGWISLLSKLHSKGNYKTKNQKGNLQNGTKYLQTVWLARA